MPTIEQAISAMNPRLTAASFLAVVDPTPFYNAARACGVAHPMALAYAGARAVGYTAQRSREIALEGEAARYDAAWQGGRE